MLFLSSTLPVCVRGKCHSHADNNTQKGTRTSVVALSHCPWSGLLSFFVTLPLTSPLATAGCALFRQDGRCRCCLTGCARQWCRTVQRIQECCALPAYGRGERCHNSHANTHRHADDTQKGFDTTDARPGTLETTFGIGGSAAIVIFQICLLPLLVF